MNYDQQNMNDRLRQWHYWWLVSFSLLLIVTFVYYLPVRFLHQASQEPGHTMAHAAPVYQESYDIQQGLSTDLTMGTSSPMAGEEATLNFFVNQKPSNIPVPINDLDAVHARVMHVLVVRSDMNEFSHIHPVISGTPGVMTVKYVFQKPGRYKLWADVTMGGTNYVFGQREILVEGEGERENKQVSFERTKSAGGYRVVLTESAQAAIAIANSITFTVYDAAGQKVKLENYLEAQMHLAVIKDDWRQLIHAHPLDSMMGGMEMMNGGLDEHRHSFFNIINQAYANGAHTAPMSAPVASDGNIAFSVTYPEPGLYKLFAQFRPKGINLPADEALAATFWVDVKNNTSVNIPASVPAQNQQLSVPQNTKTALDSGLAVDFSIVSEHKDVGMPILFNFFVNQKPEGTPVSAASLEIDHEKVIHTIGVRDDMNEFFHIHPISTDSGGVFSTTHVFQKPGRYKVWSNVTQGGTTYTFAHPGFIVEGAGSTSNKQVSFTRNVLAGDYQVNLNANDPVIKNDPTRLLFDVHSVTGGEEAIVEYLGTPMHLILIKDDGTQFIHTHPEVIFTANDKLSSFSWLSVTHAHGEDGHEHGSSHRAIAFSVTFPEVGLYKAFAQFHPPGNKPLADETLVAGFWIEVKDKTPFPISPWWMLLAISIALIAILSKYVKKYINEES